MSALSCTVNFLIMFVRHKAVLSILYITPLRINEDESSFTTASTCILPSRFFLPAIPVIFDEPSSIATIKSFTAILYIVFFLFFSFLFQFFLSVCADNLIIELYVDIVVF